MTQTVIPETTLAGELTTTEDTITPIKEVVPAELATGLPGPTGFPTVTPAGTIVNPSADQQVPR